MCSLPSRHSLAMEPGVGDGEGGGGEGRVVTGWELRGKEGGGMGDLMGKGEGG